MSLQVTVLLGHNGAGKSTTFNMICGLTSPTAGAIQICGMDVSEHLATCQEKIGYCPQVRRLGDEVMGDCGFERGIMGRVSERNNNVKVPCGIINI